MFDCNLIKSRVQKMQEEGLPSLPSATPRMPMIPTSPAMPMMPGSPAPTVPTLPPSPPEPEMTVPISPILPRVFPSSPTLKVPANPLVPPQYAEILEYESLQYLNGYLRTQIGQYIEVEFLVGTTDRVSVVGILKGVGLNYIILTDPIAEFDQACDFYNIKFVKVMHNMEQHLREEHGIT